MNIGATGTYRSNWFEFKGPYAVLKPEYKADLAAAIAEKKQQDTQALRLFMEEIKENGTAVELTDEQKAELSAKYDPEHMTREDYREFVDQLCEYGVLKQEDKPHVAYGGLTELDFAQPIAQMSAIPAQGLSSDFSSCGGNALDWARFRATFEAFDPVTQSFEKTRSALLFEKIKSVLEQIKN